MKRNSTSNETKKHNSSKLGAVRVNSYKTILGTTQNYHPSRFIQSEFDTATPCDEIHD